MNLGQKTIRGGESCGRFHQVISCSGRKALLGAQIRNETDALAEAFAPAPGLPLTGFTSFGEIAPLRHDNGCTRYLFHNMSYVMLLIEQ